MKEVAALAYLGDLHNNLSTLRVLQAHIQAQALARPASDGGIGAKNQIIAVEGSADSRSALQIQSVGLRPWRGNTKMCHVLARHQAQLLPSSQLRAHHLR